MIAWTDCVCRKRGYTSQAAAREATSGINNRVRIYQCPLSFLYHVTDSDKSQRLGKTRQEQAERRQVLRTKRRKTKARLARLT